VRAIWTPAGGDEVTLGDDAARAALELEALGAQAVEQVTELFRGASQARFPRGNARGPVVFTAGMAHADLDAAAAYYREMARRVNERGQLRLEFGWEALVWEGALLMAVESVDRLGVYWRLRYRFSVGVVEPAPREEV